MSPPPSLRQSYSENGGQNGGNLSPGVAACSQAFKLLPQVKDFKYLGFFHK